jgi:hypothetical protein
MDAKGRKDQMMSAIKPGLGGRTNQSTIRDGAAGDLGRV